MALKSLIASKDSGLLLKESALSLPAFLRRAVGVLVGIQPHFSVEGFEHKSFFGPLMGAAINRSSIDVEITRPADKAAVELEPIPARKLSFS